MRKLIKYICLVVVICFSSACADSRLSYMSVMEIIAEDNQLRADSLEVGQVWRYYGDSDNNPFESHKDKYREIINKKNGWVKYKVGKKTYSTEAIGFWYSSECTNCK